jgi:hypothetical protein
MKLSNIMHFITQNDLKQNTLTAKMIEEYRLLWLQLSELVSDSGKWKTKQKGEGIIIFPKAKLSLSL